MLKKSPLALLLSLALIGGLVPPGPAVQAQALGARANAAARMAPPALAPIWQVLQADEHQLVVEFTSPPYTLQAEATTAYSQVELPGAAYAAVPGQPRLPHYGQLVALPPTGVAQIKVLEAITTVIPGQFALAPVPSPLPRTAEFADPVFELKPDAATYATAAYLPAVPAQLVDEAWWRDQRLMRLQVSPIQYNPATGQLLWQQRLRLAIIFPEVLAETTAALAPHTAVAVPSQSIPGLLNPAQAATWRAAAPPIAQPALTPPLPGPWFKVVVDTDGLYRLSYSALQAAGMEVDNLDPRTFQLTNQGRTVAIEVSGEADGSFDPGDSVTFYGQQFKGDYLAQRYQNENLQWMAYTGQLDTGAYFTWQPGMNAEVFEEYTTENVYWLTAGGTPSPRIATLNAAPSGTAVIPTYYTATARAEEGVYWWNWHYTSQEIFFWDRIDSSTRTTRTFPITLTAVANVPFTATLRAEVVADSYNTTAGPDHNTLFYLNHPTATTVLANDFWEGRALHTVQVPVAQSQLQEGVNDLAFVMQNTAAVPNDRIYFDWFSLQYARRFQAQNDELRFPGLPAGRWQYRLSNFVSNTLTLYNITQPLTPTRLTGAVVTASGVTYTVDFEVNHAANTQFLAVSGAGVRTPKSLSRYDPPNLWAATNGADYLLITHRDLLTATQTLANYRATQGLRTKVVLIDDIYNQFNDGIFHPLAIKHFLAHIFATWQAPAPQYVVLIGDGHWNPLNFTARYGPPPPMYNPPNLSWSDPFFGEVDSANLLATVVGNDPLADTYISRMPVNSNAELSAIVAKTMAYEQQGILPWHRQLYFVADNIPDAAGDFIALSEQIINNEVPSTYTVDRFYLNNYPTPGDLTTDLIASLNNPGALILNYIGHGSNQRWAGEGILQNGHAALFANTAQWPVVLSLTCLDGYWYYATPTFQGLMETLLRLDNKGVLAAFSPTGWGVATGHDYLHRGFYNAVFDEGIWQLGPATTVSKLTLYASGANFDLLNTFTLFGDPALRLHSPYRIVGSNVNPAPQAGLPGQTLTYQVQVTNTGQLTDAVTFTASQLDWTTFSPTTVGPLAPGMSTTASVSLTILPNAPAFAVDQVALRAHSVGDILQTAAFTLTASVNLVRGVALGPTSSARVGLPGQRITHTLTLTNTGNYSDTFNLSGSPSPWATSFPATVGPLGGGVVFTLSVPVTIPNTAVLNQSTTFTLTAASQASPTYTAAVPLTTQAWWLTRLYLPIVGR